MPHLSLPGGAHLYYEVAGIGPAPVFARGLGGNHMSWWQQVPAFSDRHTCVTYSHRGFHPSTGEADPDCFADDLAALVDHLKFADVALVAQSMGGWTCLDYTLRHPERVRPLVMAETTGSLDVQTLDRDGMEARTSALFERGIHPAAVCGWPASSPPSTSCTSSSTGSARASTSAPCGPASTAPGPGPRRR